MADVFKRFTQKAANTDVITIFTVPTANVAATPPTPVSTFIVKTIILHNSNNINSDQNYPIDYKGEVTSGALRYPDLVEQYPLGKLRLTNGNVQGITTIGQDLYGGVVRFRTEYVNEKI